MGYVTYFIFVGILLLVGLVLAVLLVTMLLWVGAIAVSAGYAGVRRAYLYATGSRDRSGTIPCARCMKPAFPIEGTGTRYRCWNCSHRFAGPGHLN